MYYRIRRLVSRHLTTNSSFLLIFISIIALTSFVNAWFVYQGSFTAASMIAIEIVIVLSSLCLLVSLRLLIGFENFRLEVLRNQSYAQVLPGLHKALRPTHPLPFITGWSLDPRILTLLAQHVRKYKPSVIIEFGAGVSTLVLAQLANELSLKLISFEHDESWHERIKNQLIAFGLDESSSLHLAPLKKNNDYGCIWYDHSVVTGALPGKDIGLVVIDGPPSYAGKSHRHPAFDVITNRLATDATIVVDDYDRQDEREMVGEWHAGNPQFVMYSLCFEKETAFLTTLKIRTGDATV